MFVRCDYVDALANEMFVIDLILQVPVDCKSLNRGDVFILDNGTKIWVWCGFESNKLERIKVDIGSNHFYIEYQTCQASLFKYSTTVIHSLYIMNFNLSGDGNR